MARRPHTPGPWKRHGKTVFVYDPKNPKGWKAVANATSEGNAQLIVKAVAAYLAAREALQMLAEEEQS